MEEADKEAAASLSFRLAMLRPQTQKDDVIHIEPEISVLAPAVEEATLIYPFNREKFEVEDSQKLVIPSLYEAATSGDTVGFFRNINSQPDFFEHEISPEKNTVLHIAASFGHEEMVQLISQRFPSFLLETNSNGDTPLHLAARDGHIAVVQLLINAADAGVSTDSDINDATEIGVVHVTKPNRYEMLGKQNSQGDSALHEAAKNGHKEVLRLLVYAYPEGSFKGEGDAEGKSPLYFAAAAGFDDIVWYMLTSVEYKVDEIFPQNCKNPLHAAVIGRHAETVKIIVQNVPFLVGFGDEYGRTPLHYAAFLGFIEAVMWLLHSHRSYAYQVDKDGFSPIHMAASKGNVNIIQHMLECYPDLRELLNGDGQNFLHIAAKNGKENVVRFVLKKWELEKLINVKDCRGNTPLHLATGYCHPKIVSILAWDKRVNKGILNIAEMTALDVAENTHSLSWFRKRLTIAALEVTHAPHARDQNIFEESFKKNDLNEKPITDDFSKENNYKDRVNTLLVVAILITTMAFTASFTMPGGYKNDDKDPGIAALLSKRLFHLFVICNTIAMYSSTIVVVTLMWAQLGEVNLVIFTLKPIAPLLGLSLIMESIAFTAGVSLVVRQLSWLTNCIFILGFIFLVCALILFLPLCVSYDSKYPILRYISYCNFHILLFVTKDRSNNAGKSDFEDNFESKLSMSKRMEDLLRKMRASQRSNSDASVHQESS